MTRGWTQKERQELILSVQEGNVKKIPLKEIFDKFGKKHNRKRDSVRNFYYAVVAEATLRSEKIQGIEKAEIKMFTKNEIVKLLTTVFNCCVMGYSIRYALRTMASDEGKLLRLQNKYRNLIASKNPIVYEVMDKCKINNVYYDPFKKIVVKLEKSSIKDNERIDLIDTSKIAYLSRRNKQA